MHKEAPTFTSPARMDLTVTVPMVLFAITTKATTSPTPVLSISGALPAGITFHDNGDGTGQLSGTPTAAGTKVVTVRASNGISPDATQALSVAVSAGVRPAWIKPDWHDPDIPTFPRFAAASFDFVASGFPSPVLRLDPQPDNGTHALPPGMTFTDHHDGTAVLAGTPTSAGRYYYNLRATNPAGEASQSFVVDVT